MFTLDTFVLVKCTYFIIWISDEHRGFGLRLFSLCFALQLRSEIFGQISEIIRTHCEGYTLSNFCRNYSFVLTAKRLGYRLSTAAWYLYGIPTYFCLPRQVPAEIFYIISANFATIFGAKFSCAKLRELLSSLGLRERLFCGYFLHDNPVDTAARRTEDDEVDYMATSRTDSLGTGAAHAITAEWSPVLPRCWVDCVTEWYAAPSAENTAWYLALK